MIKRYVMGIAAALLGLMILGLVEISITGNLVKEKKTVLKFSLNNDFPNPEQGSVSLNIGFPQMDFKVGDKVADVLIFLESETVPGLKLGYDLNERKIYAGLPLLSTKEVTLTDGKGHTIVYTFNKAQKKQQIIFDGEILAEEEYTGKGRGDFFTGYSVYDNWEVVESAIPLPAVFR